MKILGLYAGNKLGNNEIMVKEALMAAEEMGAEVGVLRLLDLDIKPCTGCGACMGGLRAGGSGKCVLKDDFHFLDEQIMQSDGIILSSPVYINAPSGIIKVISDRMGPSHDVVMRMGSKKFREEHGITDGEGPDERSFKSRVAGFIAVAAAAYPEAVSMTLALMNLFTCSSNITVVDHCYAIGLRKNGHIVSNQATLNRARKLGRNVTEAAKKPIEQVKWMGDEPGTCPVCHSDLLVVGSRNPVRCPVCMVHGKLISDGDKITISFSEEELNKARWSVAGKLEVLKGMMKDGQERPDESQFTEKLKKYKGYREIPIK